MSVPHNSPAPAPSAASPSLARSLKLVAWSFLGIRRSSAHRDDLARIQPLHIVVAGLVALLVFIGALVLIVRWVAAGA